MPQAWEEDFSRRQKYCSPVVLDPQQIHEKPNPYPVFFVLEIEQSLHSLASQFSQIFWLHPLHQLLAASEKPNIISPRQRRFWKVKEENGMVIFITSSYSCSASPNFSDLVNLSLFLQTYIRCYVEIQKIGSNGSFIPKNGKKSQFRLIEIVHKSLYIVSKQMLQCMFISVTTTGISDRLWRALQYLSVFVRYAKDPDVGNNSCKRCKRPES